MSKFVSDAHTASQLVAVLRASDLVELVVLLLHAHDLVRRDLDLRVHADAVREGYADVDVEVDVALAAVGELGEPIWGGGAK